MYRHWLLAVALLLGLATALRAPVTASAQDEAAEAAADALPLSKVVMFNSGVGFFERRGEVEGDAQVQLKFKVEDVNDLLKSMVLQDLGGGKISTINYASKDPITKTLKTFAIDLTENPTLAELLGQVRGERVRIDAPNQIEGVIVGLEKRKQKVGEETIDVEVLNLLTDEGLRSVTLETVSRIKLLNEQLDAELRQALATLASGLSNDKKAVMLHFTGQGRRNVRVGYIQEAPIWKTSYRLVLGDDDKQPFLQGWAIVENTTEEDWQNVDLTLVSGRPISFVMDLYEPLYVPRPLVEPELFASLRPQTYGQDLAAAADEFRKMAEKKADAADLARDRANKARSEAERAAGMGYAGRPAQSETRGLFELQQGVQSVAQAADVGELFQYQIETPVTLPRRQSAMLPIVNGAVKAERVSIYNQDVQAKHPLNGFQFTNTTALHLMQGPITVFDGGAYAGDAQIEDLPPGSRRLVSYALDLDVEVAPEMKTDPDRLTSVRIVKGVLFSDYRYRRTQKYTVKNSGDKTKQVLVEYPYDSSWTLMTPGEPTEKTRDLYRFAVTAEPGKPAGLEVVEERTAVQQVALTNVPDNTIRIYLRSKVVSDDVKAALEEVIRRKQEISGLAAERERQQQQIAVISQEQDRIRRNMEQLDRTSDLYNRYVKKFGDQEDAVETLREQIQALIEQQAAKQKSLDEYLIGLNVQ